MRTEEQRRVRHPVRIVPTASAAVVKMGCISMYGEVQPLAAL
jgi:hypothetical protein